MSSLYSIFGTLTSFIQVLRNRYRFCRIETPPELIEVRLKMFRADLAIGANNGTLQQRPYGLNRVCMNIATHPLVRSVIHGFVRLVGIGNSKVGGVFIGHEPLRVGVRCLTYKSMQRFLGRFLAPLNPQANVAAALDCTEHQVIEVPLESYCDAVSGA